MAIHIENTPTANDSLPTVLWDNIFTRGVVTANGGVSVTNPVLNATTENTVTYWQPTSLPASIQVDMTTPVSMDSAAIVGHNCFTNGNTVFVESSTDGSAWTTRATKVPTDNTTLLMLFTAVSARYWRIRIANGTVPIISVAMIGARFNFPAGVMAPYKPVWLSQTYDLLTVQTMGGQFVGNKLNKTGGETQINLVSVERAFGESNLLPFRDHYNIGKAFVFAAGPSVFSKDVGYVWRKESSVLNPVFDQNGSWMSVSMEVYCYGR